MKDEKSYYLAKKEKLGVKRINCDVPQFVHEFLEDRRGSKQFHAQEILIKAAEDAGYKA